MSTSAPPPASLSTQRNLRPWYLVVAMICTWLIGVLGLADSFATVLFLRENNLPDVEAIIRELGDETKPLSALKYLYDAAYLRALSDFARIAFPVHVGRLILSVLLVITSAMAMSGRPGSRSFTIQVHLAYAALAVAAFWLLRDARYAAIDVVQSVKPTLPILFPSAPPEALEVCSIFFGKKSLLWNARISMAVFGVGVLVLGALTLMTARTKAYFEAVAATTEDIEDP